MRQLIGIQARTNSKRLPGKIHEKIGDRTILEHVVKACKAVNVMAKANEYIVAVLGPQGDSKLKEECVRIGVDCLLFEKEDDVLNRYVQAAERYQADAIIRITADCPFIPTGVIEECAKSLMEVDYASNCIVRSFPEGMDCQGCSVKALDWFNNTGKDREHLFQGFEANERDREIFQALGMTIRLIVNGSNPIFMKHSIDTAQELEAARKQYGNG